MRWPKYWSFSFSIIPSKEHPGLISFRMDWSQWEVLPRTTVVAMRELCVVRSSPIPDGCSVEPWGLLTIQMQDVEKEKLPDCLQGSH